ncbi:hypothetical protein ATE47_03385 [Chryseobacterium sp. IHB B 17019]|jgi:short-subunit dehydrogenase involved in D-alanine esterification of teichoic acids|uniref:hypothetical protein n=1 Tax=Chryseobacterium sp. IHB B 17019 TaxID=1721091 RepID=UPI0007221838|nr:hypothetical protein [Chryseobacterium sp. IHB B 17019]ALR29627.1 hypothetical protein ATE47_03385 [Chryseobacterium sp. IHB B 17019]
MIHVGYRPNFAFIPYSASPVYSTPKARVHAYPQALHLQLDKTCVKVIELMPQGMNTNLQNDWCCHLSQPNDGGKQTDKYSYHF